MHPGVTSSDTHVTYMCSVVYYHDIEYERTKYDIDISTTHTPAGTESNDMITVMSATFNYVVTI